MKRVHWAEAMNSPNHDDAPSSVQLACVPESFRPVALYTKNQRGGVCTDHSFFAMGLCDVTCTDCKAIIKERLGGNFA